MRHLAVLTLLSLCLAAPLAAEEITIPVDDQFALPGQIDRPDSGPRGVVVLVHGSGAHSREEELAAVTEGKQANPFFGQLSQALVAEGWAVLRYDKRNYACAQAGEVAARARAQLLEDPAEALIEDARSALKVARHSLPGIPLVLLGHSEGTWVALQAAEREQGLTGVACIAYSGSPLDTLIHEQYVYRPLSQFFEVDQNKDGYVDGTEVQSDRPMARALQAQFANLDLDRDGRLSLSEMMGANVSNLYLKPIPIASWRKREAQLPQLYELVQKAETRLAFFQGEWDNQTPAYYVRGLELCENLVWKKGNKLFRYYERCGHALDPRTSWDDITYRRPEPQVLQDLARKFSHFFLQP